MQNNNKKRTPFTGENGEKLTYAQYYRMVCQNIPKTRDQPKTNSKPVVSTRFGYYKVEKSSEVLNFENYFETMETIRRLEEDGQDEVFNNDQVIDTGGYDEFHEAYDPADMENMHLIYSGKSNNPDWGTAYK